MRTKSYLVALLALAIVLPPAPANAAMDSWRIGLMAGQVGLLGDVSNDDPSSVGVGLTAGFFTSEELVVEAAYVSSDHTSTNHRDLSFGVNYFFSDYVAAYPNLSAGVSFISNSVNNPDATGDAFGLYVGGGFDFELMPQFTTGIHGRFQKVFEGKTQVRGVDVTTVDDSFTVLLRFLYSFGDLAE